jgi:hypothetical protein
MPVLIRFIPEAISLCPFKSNNTLIILYTGGIVAVSPLVLPLRSVPCILPIETPAKYAAYYALYRCFNLTIRNIHQYFVGPKKKINPVNQLHMLRILPDTGIVPYDSQ